MKINLATNTERLLLRRDTTSPRQPQEALALSDGTCSFILLRGHCSVSEWEEFLRKNNLQEAGEDGLIYATAKWGWQLPLAAYIFSSLSRKPRNCAYSDLFGHFHYLGASPGCLASNCSYLLARLT